MEDLQGTLDSLDLLDVAEDPLQFWQQKQRELVTSVVDYNLGTLTDLIRSESIDLSPKYQRRFRWDIVRQSRLIESFLMNVPVPPIFLNEDEYGKYSVIDGKQRLHAISDFFQNNLTLSGLEVFSELNDLRMRDLPKPMQTALRTRPTLRAVIILRQSDPDVQLEVFQRLNSGGIRLNPQEIRNSAFPGPLNDLIVELSTTPLFHQLLGIPKNKRSAIYDDMRDAELVLRYLTFRNNWAEFSGSMKYLMDEFMRANREMAPDDIALARVSFLRTVRIVSNAFGKHAFRRYIPEKATWRQQILASLYDAEMFACQEFAAIEVRDLSDRIVPRLMELFSDQEFKRTMEAATNNAGNFRLRIQAVRTVVGSVVNG